MTNLIQIEIDDDVFLVLAKYAWKKGVVFDQLIDDTLMDFANTIQKDSVSEAIAAFEPQRPDKVGRGKSTDDPTELMTLEAIRELRASAEDDLEPAAILNALKTKAK